MDEEELIELEIEFLAYEKAIKVEQINQQDNNEDE